MPLERGLNWEELGEGISTVKTHAMKFSKICSKNERKKKRSVPQLPDLCLWVLCGAEKIITDASWCELGRTACAREEPSPVSS